MTRTVGDSTTAADVPQTVDIVAGYIDGRYKWSDADWALFPGKPQVRIATSADTDDGNCLDVEKGDATPSQAPVWVVARRAAGIDPTCYVNLANWQETKNAFAGAGIAEPHWWVAHYNNDPTIPAGAVAKQYQNEPLTGGHYDLSSCADIWPGVDAMPIDPELKAYIDAKFAEAYGVIEAVARRQMRGEDPLRDDTAPITAGENIFLTTAK